MTITTGVCPECAREFDPADSKTFWLPRRGWWSTYTPGWPSWANLAVFCLFSMWVFSPPIGGYVFAPIAVFLWGVATGTVWLVTLFVAFVVRYREFERAGVTSWRDLRRWMPHVAVGLVLVGLLGARVPSRLRFALSRGALEATAKSALAGNSPSQLSRIGLYDAYVNLGDPGTVKFVLPEFGFLDSPVLIYSPSGPPDPALHAEHLEGPWYTGWEDF